LVRLGDPQIMPETFLILVAGGIMLAVAIPRPRDVTVHWLRLAGIIALAMGGIGIFFAARRAPMPPGVVSGVYLQIQRWMLVAAVLAILLQLATAQSLRIRAQRAFAIIAYLMAVMVGAGMLHVVAPASTFTKPQAIALQTLACAGVAATTGIALMDMLLGHAYLTAAKMTIAPFRRLNFALACALGARGGIAAAALVIQHMHPIEQFWSRFGLYIGTRWMIGLLVPAVFVYMAHDCIRRRSTQSATGILYVTAVLIFIGELIALYLARETGLPL
jgi:hypothetical protein